MLYRPKNIFNKFSEYLLILFVIYLYIFDLISATEIQQYTS